MRVLICTVFDIDIPCAGLNRLTRMSKALVLYGIESFIVVGSGSIPMDGKVWKTWEEQGQKYIIYNKSLFAVKRHCNGMRIVGTAAKFYKMHLSEIVDNLSIAGAIVYSPQHQLITPFLYIRKRKNIFVLADCGENFSLSIRHLLNGVIYQQFMFRLLQMKKMDGAIIASPRWSIDTEKSKIPACMIPGFLEPQKSFRSSASAQSDKFIITIMGRFAGREMPSVIIKALKICKQNGLNFQVNLVGTGSGGMMEVHWLNKITHDPDICNNINNRGFVSNSERDELLTSSDIFIMLRPPSKETAYTYPSRVPEYLFSGNPIILTDTPSLNEFFYEEKGAYFISSKNDSAELANLITNLADKPADRFECGKRGREYAIKNFSLKVMGKKLSEFLFEINSKTNK